ncbi:protein-lysine N-methyltransferase EEF2KMT [Leptinotarsa decemlineata]|uniref:protein-lysine N-methyltransferase EEF2KMT n=1 Tax=Leptinotarsa decemlineata TaxID=7539 RepID=UPI003D30B678
MASSHSKNISSVTKQFMCSVPLRSFNWHDIFNDLIRSEDLQKTLLTKTVNSPLVLECPLEINYQKLYLKHLIQNLEKLQSGALQETVICDELYTAYGRLVALGSSSQCFKHYLLGTDDKVISLQESSNLISDGTTGLRTWQASLALSEWLLQNKSLFTHKTVLELGSGIGLTGLVLARECSAKCVFLTDCHETVLKILRYNVERNLKQYSVDEVLKDTVEILENCSRMNHRCLYHNSKATTHVLNLPWEEIDEGECKKLGTVETIIAADIVYDDELFEPLIKAMKNLAVFSGVEEFIFSCTERNPSTLDTFLRKMVSASFVATNTEVPPQQTFFWPIDTPVKIFKFTLKK